MNDTIPPPAPLAPPSPPPQPPATVKPSRSAAAWLAVAGSALLLVAAIVVVASKWALIPQSVRFAGLFAAVVLIAGLAEQLRRSAPITAASIAHLVPGMAITVGIAAGATLEKTWPVCIVAGGLLGIAVTEVQKRRWTSPRMALIAAAGVVLVAAGVAANTAVPVTVLAGGAAVLLWLARRRLEAGALAAVVGVSPVLATMTTLKVGDGTMARIGAAGQAVAWASPIAGVLAAIVLGLLAHRHRSAALAGATVTALVVNVVAGLAVGVAPTALWISLIPAALLAIELGALVSGDGIWQQLCKRASRHTSKAVAFGGPGVAGWGFLYWAADLSLGSTWALPVALAATTSLIVAVRSRSAASPLTDPALSATVGFGVVLATVLGASSPVVSAVALALLIGVCAVSRLRCPVAVYSAGGYLAVSIAQRVVPAWWHNDTQLWTAAPVRDLAMIVIGGLLCANFVKVRGQTAATVAVLGVTGGLAMVVAPDWQAAVATAVVALVGLVTAWRRPQLGVAAAAVAGVFAVAVLGDIEWASVVAILCAAAVTFINRRHIALRLAGSAEVMVAAWVALQIADVTPNGLVGGMLAAAVTLTGLAFTTRRLTELDGAAWASTALAGVSLQIAATHPALVSLVLLVAAAQGLVYGLARQRRELVTGSAAAGTVALVSLWFTSGTNAAILRGLARFDFTASDLTVLMVGVLLLGVGAVVRKWQPVSTWLAFGPGLGLVAAWLIPVQLERHADWATMVGLAVGITALGIGGLRKLAAPLVIGTGLTATTVVVASGSQLSSLPGWTWLVVGGAALLSLAALVERRSKNEAGLTGGIKAMLEQFQ